MPNPKLAPPPPVALESWKTLIAAAEEFAALKPWGFMRDSEPVGLIDPVTSETRIGTVLGNGGEVFAAVFYRRAGLRWILNMLSDGADPADLNIVDGMDCLKVEFVAKRELWKEDLAVLKNAGFIPAAKGLVWPQFRSSELGWHPWHINQSEADQLLTDLPRLTQFCKLFEKHPGLFDGRDVTEIPFLPVSLPDRPLAVEDLDWRPFLPPPATGMDPFRADDSQLGELRALKRQPGLVCEFDCTVAPGASFVENGRPCFARLSLLVETQRGLVLGMAMSSAVVAPGEAAGRGLVETLLMAKMLPQEILIAGPRLQAVLQPLCNELQIQLRPVVSLPMLEEAVHSLSQHMMAIG